MTKHKTEDYKISAVKYYLNNDRGDGYKKTCKIFDCKKSTLRDWIKRYKTTKNLTRKNRKPISYKITKPQVKTALELLKKNEQLTMNKLQFTASQRKIESYGKRNERILLQEKKRNNIIEKETHLSSKNSKSIDYEKFKVFLVEKDKLNKETTEFYKRDVWRKMKFRQYSYGKKSIDTFLNKIKETFGDNVLIGYGNWSRNTQMKHIMPTMNKGLRKLIHKKYDTITINEYYTSQKCCECYTDLKHCKDKKGKEIYRLFQCSNCVSSKNKNIVFRTRDKNSAISIMKLTKEWINTQTRPSEFQRQSSFTCGTPLAGLSKTIGNEKVAY